MRDVEIEKLRSRLSQRKPRRRRSRSPSGGSYVVRRHSHRGGSRSKRQKSKRRSTAGKRRKRKSVQGGLRSKNASEVRSRRGRKIADSDEADYENDEVNAEVDRTTKKQKRQSKNKKTPVNENESDEYLPGTSRNEFEEYENEYDDM